jgi:hypothetical protein
LNGRGAQVKILNADSGGGEHGHNLIMP